MTKYMPSVSIDDNTATPRFNNAYMIEQVIRRCGDGLTRENLLKQAASLKDKQPPPFLDGIKVRNSSTDCRAIHNFKSRFDGANWPLDDLVDLNRIA